MKLASLRDGARDGRLVVVSRDITQASDVRHIAPSLQAALDGWDRLAPHLDLVARGVEAGGQPVERFHEREARAPLPRAYRLVVAGDGGLALRAADVLLGARDPLPPGPVAAAVAVVVGDVPAGADRQTALAAIRLVALLTLAGDGATAMSPVAVTPDELGDAWDGARLGAAIEANGRPLDPGEGADFGDLIVTAARTAALGAGAIVAAPPRAVPARPGETLRLQVRDAAGHPIFGALEHPAAP